VSKTVRFSHMTKHLVCRYPQSVRHRMPVPLSEHPFPICCDHLAGRCRRNSWKKLSKTVT
jgi:hypothetical protein